MKQSLSQFLKALAFLIPTLALYADEIAPSPIAESISNPILEADANGRVVVMAAIDRRGKVFTVNTISATNDELAKACSRAIKSWKFYPAQSDGLEIFGMYEHTFTISNGKIVSEANLTENETSDISQKIAQSIKEETPEPVAVSKSKPVLPIELSNVSGYVKVHFQVTTSGITQEANAVEYSHVELIKPVIEAASKWSFDKSPSGRSGAIRERTITFKFDGSRNSNNVNSVLTSEITSEAVAIRTRVPELTENELLEGSKFSAELTVDSNGYVAEVAMSPLIAENQVEQFKQAFYSWKFRPALKGNKTVSSYTTQSFHVLEGQLQPVVNPVEQTAVILQSTTPKLRASQLSLQGYVLVTMDIDESGNVTHAQVVESTNEKLDTPSIEASRKWKFLPAKQNNVAVKSSLLVPFVYPIKG